MIKNSIKDAYHEAGHAIIADHYELLWHEASIVRDIDKMKNGWIFAEDLSETKENCLRAASYFMAGATAMLLFVDCNEVEAIVSAKNDIERVNDFCLKFGENIDWVTEGMKEATRILLCPDNQRRVEILVELLLNKNIIKRDVYLKALNKQNLSHK